MAQWQAAHNPEVWGSKPRSAIFLRKFNFFLNLMYHVKSGPGSVMVSHLTPDQKILGSNPSWVNSFFNLFYFFCF